MRGAVAVRTAVADDVAALAKLVEDGDAGHLRRGESPADRERRFDELLGEARRVVLVACDDAEHICGLLVASVDEVGALHPVLTLSVSTLVVAPQSRRRGVGRSLLAGAVHAAEERGIESLVASVAGTDREANRYLARLGFAPLVVDRIASTTALRRTLGMTDRSDRIAALRRTRRGVAHRGLATAQVVGRRAGVS